jgi:polysaccharide export outer membrane protein
VTVLGQTIPECREMIEEHLSKFLERPQVSVDVTEMSSKKYYVILKFPGGEQILMFPCTGNDTVMKAITDMKTLPGSLSDVGIQHIRPGKDDGDAKTTQLQWSKILLHRAGYGQNLQLLPGDRIIIEIKK